MPCWSETDSLVDWIAEGVVIQTLDPVADTQLPPEERIHRYIVQNSPAKTSDILAQRLAGKSHTFWILGALQTADKIEKLKHGYYEAI